MSKRTAPATDEQPAFGGRYILDADGDPIPCSDLVRWAQCLRNATARIIGRDIVNGHQVSTVFVGMDHSFGLGGGDQKPVLWETAIFWDWREGIYGNSNVMERYESKVDAYMGHQRWRGKVAAGLVSPMDME